MIKQEVIRRLMVANRAEIASRVFRTCRALGIETVAVHSDADADLPYVAEADYAVRLPGNAPSETYLDAEAVLAAAKRAGADAIHPGYGFLSENATFARAVEQAGLTWVGPAPESIEQMGSKVESKKLMEAAGVPVLRNLTVDTATEEDLPLLVKASAGGGGRGMRIVRTLADLPGEIEKASAEAESAFGDGTVFVETYVEKGRHVEVQVVGSHVFGERDCSIQRRHQKVVEETPAPNLPDATRAALHDAARKAAGAIDYRGAGTVEFLYDEDNDRFFFLEMNTRLQVEHPVTEEVHGVDLVAAQIAVAEGREIESPRAPSGHAIEIRLYAEDPAADYQPQSGLLTAFEIEEGDGIRVDSGFAAGNEVSTYYDAMLAKVIAYAPTREEAARKLAGALSRARIHGLVTNRDLLVEILRDPDFLEGRVSTAFLAGSGVSRLAALAPQPPVGDAGAPVAAALALAERDRMGRTVQQGIPVAWRNVVSQPQRTEFEGDVTVEWYGGRDGYVVDGFTVVAAGQVQEDEDASA
jgi:propionyl-CoA carboxylase alpha chain